MRRFRIATVWSLLFAVAVFVGALVFYVTTGPSNLAWLEGAHYQRRVALTQVGEGPWDQPLYILLSQPFQLVPWGTVPRRASLASAVFAAGACVLVYLLLRALLTVAPQFIARRVGVLAAISIGVAHTFWLRAVTPGPEVLDALLLAAILYCLVRFANEGRVGTFYAAMAILGLSLANNLMMLFFFPFFAVWVRLVRPPLVREIGMVRFRGLLVLLAGSALALAVTAWGWSAAGFRIPPERLSWLSFWRDHMMLTWDAELRHSLSLFSVMLLYNFPPWTATIGLLGFIELFQRQKYVFWLVFPLLAVHSFLVVTLRLSEPIPSYLPAWVLLSVAVGYGWWKTLAESTWKGFVVALILSLAPVGIYHFAARTVERIGEDVRVAALIRPSFEAPLGSLELYLNPDRRNLPPARTFARATLSALPEQARIVAPSWEAEKLLAPVRYLSEVEGIKPVLVFTRLKPQTADQLERWAQDPEKPLFIAGLHPPSRPVEALLDRYDLRPVGFVFGVQPRSEPNEAMEGSEAEPVLLAGEWAGFERPQGYRVDLTFQQVPDGTFSGNAVLNRTSPRPLEGSFTRITDVGSSFLARVTYKDRVHVHIDATRTADRIEGTWQVFEVEGLSGSFVVWKKP